MFTFTLLNVDYLVDLFKINILLVKLSYFFTLNIHRLDNTFVL